MLSIITAVVLILLLIKTFCKLTAGRCTSPVCLVGKTALVTGGNSGLGYQTALALAGRGCRVIIADKDDCENSRKQIIQETGNNNITIKHFDLASLSSVRKLAVDINQTEARLHILINNAGTMGLGNDYTEDGLHIGMQVNHFGPFLLTHLLAGLLKKSAPSRIIFMSSILAFVSNLTVETLNWPRNQSKNLFSETVVYSNSKLCGIISSNEFAKKLQASGVTCNSLHPGVVYTPIFKKCANGAGNRAFSKKLIYMFLCCLYKLCGKDAEQGAQTTIHLALAQELKNVTGKYFIDCKPFVMPSLAKNQEFSRKIWKSSEVYVKLMPEEML